MPGEEPWRKDWHRCVCVCVEGGRGCRCVCGGREWVWVVCGGREV